MQNFINQHSQFKEKSLTYRRFKHAQVLQLINACGFEHSSVGTSFEGRDIRKVVAGTGKRKVLLWSQMHGNEATATMALFDIFNFLKGSGDEFDSIRKTILGELELHFVPMINPDGAERFQRRTSQEIDMNRDAVALQCPESRILKSLVMGLQPEFSFNLHDQAIYYAAGDAPVQATVAFLATAYNKETEWNEVRTKAMQVICEMNDELQKVIPGRVGRFSDEFEPRAFGDNIQKWGSSLILVESGGYPDDIEKQYIRALNFHAVLSGLYAIASESYGSHALQEYESIPSNNRIFLDLKITNLTIENNSGDFKVDIGIINEEKNINQATDFVYESVIEDIGDLSVFHGIKTLDARGGKLKPLTDFPALIELYNIKDFPSIIELGEKATFIIDYGNTQTLILNGEII